MKNKYPNIWLHQRSIFNSIKAMLIHLVPGKQQARKDTRQIITYSCSRHTEQKMWNPARLMLFWEPITLYLASPPDFISAILVLCWWSLSVSSTNNIFLHGRKTESSRYLKNPPWQECFTKSFQTHPQRDPFPTDPHKTINFSFLPPTFLSIISSFPITNKHSKSLINDLEGSTTFLSYLKKSSIYKCLDSRMLIALKKG